MFEIGDYVIYGDVGVCKISNITKLDTAYANKELLYFVLGPVYEDSVIFAPVNSGKVRMRHIITKSEAENLIDTIPTIQAKAYHSSAIRELTDHYSSIIKTNECADLIELTMSIYAKKTMREKDSGKLGMIDQRFMKQAESLLFGELSVALGIPKADVQKYIEERVG